PADALAGRGIGEVERRIGILGHRLDGASVEFRQLLGEGGACKGEGGGKGECEQFHERNPVTTERGDTSGQSGAAHSPGVGAGRPDARSRWPRSRPGSTRSRSSCLSCLASGKPPSRRRAQTSAPSSRISKTPPVPGT